MCNLPDNGRKEAEIAAAEIEELGKPSRVDDKQHRELKK